MKADAESAWGTLLARQLCTGAMALLLGCSSAAGDRSELVVSAASSLTDVVTRLADEYTVLHPGVTIATNFASSGTLVQQIRQGAGVDLFLPAAEREMELLAEEGLIDEETRRVIAANELVLVVPRGSTGVRGLPDLAGPRVGRIALGAPASVPAGAYARETLRRMGLWAAVEPRAVFTSNVRQALAYVERGEVDAALVYRTDALRTSGVTAVATAPPDAHAPIRYPAAVVSDAGSPAEARRFLDFLVSPAGRAAFAAYGFALPSGGEGGD